MSVSGYKNIINKGLSFVVDWFNQLSNSNAAGAGSDVAAGSQIHIQMGRSVVHNPSDVAASDGDDIKVVFDLSGNNNDWTTQNAEDTNSMMVYRDDGVDRFGTALQPYADNNSKGVPYTTGVSYTNAFTIIWNAAGGNYIFSNDRTGSAGMQIDNNGTTFRVGSTSGTAGVDYVTLTGTLTGNDGHLTRCITCGGTTGDIKLYENGVLIDTQSITGASWAETNNWITQNQILAGGNQGGRYASFVIYDSVLSDEDILSSSLYLADYYGHLPTSIQDVVNNVQGTYVNSPTFTDRTVVLDGVSQCIDFDAISDTLNLQTKGTLEFWIKFTDATPLSIQNIFSVGSSVGGNSLTFDLLTDGKIRCYFVTGGTAQFLLRTDSAFLTDNTWHHIVLVQDGIQPTIYIDSQIPAQNLTVSLDTTAWFSDFDIPAAIVRLGCTNTWLQSFVNDRFVNGEFSVAEIYDDALTADEVANNYRALKYRF